MISKKHFLEQMKKLNTLYPESALSNEQVMIYYEFLSRDFTDTEFDAAINHALKTSFKFPPIAAFYKKEKSEEDILTEVFRGCR
jgi:hypothetical protein